MRAVPALLCGLLLTFPACGGETDLTEPDEEAIFALTEFIISPNPASPGQTFLTKVKLTVTPRQEMVYTELHLIAPGHLRVLASSENPNYEGDSEFTVEQSVDELTSQYPGVTEFTLRWIAMDADRFARATVEGTLQITTS